MKTIACTFAIDNFSIPLKLTIFICFDAIDSFGCSTSMETFWVHYYIWKYLPATIKLTTDRPMKGLTDRLTDIVTYIVAIASKNIQFLSWGWGSVTKQLFFFILLIQNNKCYCLFFVFWRGEGVAVLSGKSLRFAHIA